VYITDEPVEATARHESVDAPRGILIPVPVVVDAPVAVLDRYGVAPTSTVDLNVKVVDAEVPPAIDAVIVGDSATASVTLIQAIPDVLKLAAERFQTWPAVELAAELLTFAIIAEPDGVTATDSPGARVVALPEASLSVNFTKDPDVPEIDEDELIAVIAIVETPVETLIVKV
jgi:hypothetical protein